MPTQNCRNVFTIFLCSFRISGRYCFAGRQHRPTLKRPADARKLASALTTAQQVIHLLDELNFTAG
jgi:hypothetical protein